jgi:nucleoside-diphosphate-sugar epimerase
MAYTAVVTGASGFVASHIVKQLLEKGYDVRGTVRSLANGAPLLRLADALPGTLQLFEADLLKEGSFDAAIEGARFVFHTASPFFIDSQDKQADLVDPAVGGTENVLGSVLRHKNTVQRIVVTSSCAGAKLCTSFIKCSSARVACEENFTRSKWWDPK